VLKKGAYELVDYEGNVLLEPGNGLYIKSTMLEPHGLSTSYVVVLFIFCIYLCIDAFFFHVFLIVVILLCDRCHGSRQFMSGSWMVLVATFGTLLPLLG
jgi:hypothetical protein